MDSNNDFDQNFMKNVKEGVQRQEYDQVIASRKALKRKIIIVDTIILVIIAIAAALIVVMKKAPAEEVVYEESSDEGTAREYGDDDNETVVAIRMACMDRDKRYDFYKDNTYEVINYSTDETIESGTYTIDGDNFSLEVGGVKRTITYDGKKIIDGDLTYGCEEYENV